MSFEGLPPDLRDRPLPDLVAEDLLDLVLGPCDRLDGSVLFLLCDEHDRMLVPVVVDAVPRGLTRRERLHMVTTVTAAVAGTGASVLIGVGQATNRHAASHVRAWVEAAAEACQGRVRLLGVWSCTTRSARRMDAHV